jgi:hypothetical protein
LLAGSQKFHARNAVPARARDPAHRHVNDLPLAEQFGETVAQFLVTGASELVDAAVAVEADYLGRVVEGAENMRVMRPSAPR